MAKAELPHAVASAAGLTTGSARKQDTPASPLDVDEEHCRGDGKCLDEEKGEGEADHQLNAVARENEVDETQLDVTPPVPSASEAGRNEMKEPRTSYKPAT